MKEANAVKLEYWFPIRLQYFRLNLSGIFSYAPSSIIVVACGKSAAIAAHFIVIV